MKNPTGRPATLISLLAILMIGLSAETAIAQQAQPADHIQIATDSAGVKRFTLHGQPFVPIGVNYLREGQAKTDGKIYKTFDMFDVGVFDANAVDANLRAISEGGFNYVRLWLKGGDPDSGFASPAGTFDTQRWSAYVKNVALTIQTARKYHLHVVLTGSFPGPSQNLCVPKNYLPDLSTVPGTAAVDGLNRLTMIPQMAQALGRFYADLLKGLKEIDPGIGADIFYIDAYNELHFELDKPPFATASGTFAFLGRQYNLADFNANDQTDPASRQALMDSAADFFFKTVSASIKSVMPDALVNASSGFNYASGHQGFDGGRDTKKHPNNYMLRPYYELAGGASLLDFHIYPSPALPQYKLPDYAQRAQQIATTDEIYPVNATASPPATAITAKQAALIVGEYGAEDPKYGVTATQPSAEFSTQYQQSMPKAIAELKATINQGLCPLGFTGYAVWDWNSNPTCCYPMVSSNDPQYLVMQALAPRYTPTYCGQSIGPAGR